MMSIATESEYDWPRLTGLTPGNADEISVHIVEAVLSGGSKIRFSGAGVTAIVGANNCGKSTFLRQLGQELLGQNHLQPDEYRLVTSVLARKTGSARDLLDWFTKNSILEEPSPQNGMTRRFRRLNEVVDPRSLTQAWDSISPGTLGPLAPLFVRRMEAGERNVNGTQRKNSVLDAPTHPFHHLADDERVMDELNQISQKIFRRPLTLDDQNMVIQLKVGSPGLRYPREPREKIPYQRALDALPALDRQGDGMRSLLGILIPLITSTFQIVIVDEPEAFLHPPQAYALGQELGRIAQAKNVQVVVATHDRNLLSGLLDSRAPTSVVRLNRKENSTTAHQLESSDLLDIWQDPVLRYSNVLDGLFHQLVVLAEGERDCRFYQAALEEFSTEADGDLRQISPGGPAPSDVLFVPANGKAGMAKLAKALASVDVPVVASPDLDVLNEQRTLSGLVTSLGREWTGLDRDYNIATAAFRAPRQPVLVAEVKESLKVFFDETGSEANFDQTVYKKLVRRLPAAASRWQEVKDYGLSAFKGQAAPAVHKLLDALATRHVVPVRVGELERFAPLVIESKGPAWLPAALAAGAHKSAEAQDHIRRILASAREASSAPDEAQSLGRS